MVSVAATVNVPNQPSLMQVAGAGPAGSRGAGRPPNPLAAPASVMRRMAARGAGRPLQEERWEGHDAALGGIDRSFRRVRAARSGRCLRRQLGRARLRGRLARRFRYGRRRGAVGPAGPHRARPRAFQSQIHHRRRGRPAESDPGDHPNQAQKRGQSALQPHERARTRTPASAVTTTRSKAARATTSPTSSSPRASKARSSTIQILHSRANATPSR